MDQQTQLTQLIERALENGWIIPWFSSNYKPQHLAHEIRMYEEIRNGYALTDLLFGDNLSFLKALVGDKPNYIADEPYIEIPMYESIAWSLVALPDAERTPRLHEMVFGDLF